MKSRLFLFVGICILCITSFCQAADTVKIAAIFPKTGDAASSTLSYFRGLRFAVDQVNQQGGLLGKQIELLELDNKSTALGSKIAAKQAVDAGAVGVVGALWSSHTPAIAPVLQEAKIPLVTPSSNPAITPIGDYIFRVVFIDSFQGLALAKFAVQDLQAKTAVVLTNIEREYSIELAKFFIDEFQQQGGEILWEGDYPDDETDFAPLAQKVNELKPDVVFIPSGYRDSAFIIAECRKNDLSIPFLGGDGWGVRMYEYAGDAVNGNYYSTHWHREISTTANQKFLQAFEAAQGEIKSTSIPIVYDAFMLLVDGIRRAGSFDHAHIRDALAATENFQGVTGNITLDENRDPLKPVVILKLDQGAAVFVKTVEP